MVKMKKAAVYFYKISVSFYREFEETKTASTGGFA